MAARATWVLGAMGACLFFAPLSMAANAAVNLDAVAKQVATAPVDSLVRDVERMHPMAMMLLAKRLFDNDRKDDAVFWFYEGQLRWRSLLQQNGSRAGGGPFSESESDRFGRLFETLGPDINGYAAGDV